MRSYLIAGLIVVLPALALAETPAPTEAADGVLTYEMFEAAVPHADLAECPAGLARDDSFCRLTLAEGDAIDAYEARRGAAEPWLVPTGTA